MSWTKTKRDPRLVVTVDLNDVISHLDSMHDDEAVTHLLACLFSSESKAVRKLGDAVKDAVHYGSSPGLADR